MQGAQIVSPSSQHLTTPLAVGNNVHIDALKCLAAFSVILLHAAAPHVEQILAQFGQGASVDPIGWMACNFYDAASRWCVPVFIMISGLLLLDDAKEEPLGVFYSKRASRILIPLLFWSLFYSVFAIGKSWGEHGGKAALLAAGTNILRGLPHYHMWFLYVLVGIYAFVPFIRKAVRVLTPNELSLLCALLLGFSVLVRASSYFEPFRGENGIFLARFPPYLAYFILGYHLPRLNALKSVNKAIPAALFVVGVLSTAFICHLFAKHQNVWMCRYCYDFFFVGVILASVSIFLLFQRNAATANYPKIVAFLAPTMLGVYLVHPPILRLSRILWPFGDHQMWYALPVISICTYLVAAALTKAMQKTPFCRRLV